MNTVSFWANIVIGGLGGLLLGRMLPDVNQYNLSFEITNSSPDRFSRWLLNQEKNHSSTG